MVIIGKYNKSVILTYIGGIFALFGMIFAIIDNLQYSLICLMLAGICDLFDGKIARMCKRTDIEKEFGKQIDSLVDVFSFVALPCVIAIKLFLNINIWLCIIMIFYLLSGIIRLAWFNIISSKEEAVKYFIGVPVAYIAVVLPIIYAMDMLFKLNIDFIYPIVYIIFAVLFILNIKIPKPRKMAYIVFIVLAILISLILLLVK